MGKQVQWNISLSNGKNYIVVNEFKNVNEFMNYLFTGNGTSVISIHELKKPIEYEDITVSNIAINAN